MMQSSGQAMMMQQHALHQAQQQQQSLPTMAPQQMPNGMPRPTGPPAMGPPGPAMGLQGPTMGPPGGPAMGPPRPGQMPQQPGFPPRPNGVPGPQGLPAGPPAMGLRGPAMGPPRPRQMPQQPSFPSQPNGAPGSLGPQAPPQMMKQGAMPGPPMNQQPLPGGYPPQPPQPMGPGGGGYPPGGPGQVQAPLQVSSAQGAMPGPHLNQQQLPGGRPTGPPAMGAPGPGMGPPRPGQAPQQPVFPPRPNGMPSPQGPPQVASAQGAMPGPPMNQRPPPGGYTPSRPQMPPQQSWPNGMPGQPGPAQGAMPGAHLNQQPPPGGYPPQPQQPVGAGAGGYPPGGPGQVHAPPQMPGQHLNQQPPPGGYPPQPQQPMGPSTGGYPPGGPGQAQAPRRALDPDQMPSPIHVIEEDQKTNTGYFDTKEKGLTPPLVTTKFVVRDHGNASPRFIRSTMYNVPATPDMIKQTGVPFALVISPFATVADGEHEPPVSDFGPTGPVRCIRCKAYMCPFMQFIDGGRRFQCVFCKATTEVPQEYFAHLDHNGSRLDHYQRPELCLGAYECLATKDYCRDNIEPKVPGVIFAIDVSYPMMKEGVVQLICKNMKDLLKHLPHDINCDKEKMRVGFMTYDSKIHFYNLNKGLSQPQMLTVGDVNDMFVPLVEGFMVNVEESEAVIDALMEQIPQMFGETRETETVLGPVIQAGKEAFKAAQCAGKLIVFHHNLPVAEAPGKLKNRDDRKMLGTEKEKTVLIPQNSFYTDIGKECVSVGCSVDLFLFNNAYVDVSTLSQVSRLTGGQVYKYTYFQTDTDGERFLNDLEHNLSRPVVFDAIMRVRTSTGVRPVDFYGSFYMANTTDTELAAINADSAVACEIKHDDKLTEEDGVYIQAAILFTSCSGQRRLRVLNLSLNTGVSMADTYRNCELDTIVNFVAKQSISRLMESNPKTVKENLVSNCAQILACYRKNCASPSSAGQLILPECMKLLPLYTNCLVKSDAIAGGADVGCDDRAFLMSAVSSMDVTSSAVFFYPRLFPLHDLNTSEEGMPDQIRCSMEKIRDEGVYLLENGIYLFMYIGLAADPNFIQDVFGVPSAAQVVVERTFLEARDNPMSERVRNVISVIQSQRGSRYMRLVLVRQKDKLDILFRHYLCEDRSGNSADSNFSYVDFLCHMHKEIRALLG